MLNISFHIYNLVEAPTNVSMLLGTLTVCKIIIGVRILLARQCRD